MKVRFREESATAGFRTPASTSHLSHQEMSQGIRGALVPDDAECNRSRDEESSLSSAACARSRTLDSYPIVSDMSTRAGREGLDGLLPPNS